MRDFMMQRRCTHSELTPTVLPPLPYEKVALNAVGRTKFFSTLTSLYVARKLVRVS